MLVSRKKIVVFASVLLSLLLITTSAASTSSSVDIGAFGTIHYSGMPDLVYSTSFEDAVKISSDQLSLSFPHYFSLGGGGTFWVEDKNNPTEGAPTPRSGDKCLGLSTPASTASSLRSEFELYPHNWQGGILQDEFFVSAWLYLPNDWALHGQPLWYELLNTFVCTGSGYYPRNKSWICRENNAYNLQYRYSTGAGAAGTLINQINDFHVPTGEWFNVKYYIKRDQTNGEFALWLSTSYYGNDYLIGYAVGYQTQLGAETGWFTVPAKIYLDGDGYAHKLWVDNLEIWTGLPPGL